MLCYIMLRTLCYYCNHFKFCVTTWSFFVSNFKPVLWKDVLHREKGQPHLQDDLLVVELQTINQLVNNFLSHFAGILVHITSIFSTLLIDTLNFNILHFPYLALSQYIDKGCFLCNIGFIHQMVRYCYLFYSTFMGKGPT